MQTFRFLLGTFVTFLERTRYRRNLAGVAALWISVTMLLLAPFAAWGATPKPVIAYSPSSEVFTLGTTITTLTPTNTGGATTNWSITPALPNGLTFSGANGQIAGTPTNLSTIKTYTVKATNAGGSGSTTLKVTVDAVLPTLSYSPASEVCTKGSAITPLTPTTGGGAVVTWSITPALSAGLTFSAPTGVISGIPTALKAITNYTVKATNSGGSATATVTLTVDNIPPVINYNPSTYTFTKGKAITAVSPTSIGGAVVSWSVNPSLPAGLTLSTTTGKITGTPTVVIPESSFIVTATNTGGSASASLMITINDKAPAFSYNPATETYTYATPIPVLSPTSTGGTVVSWSISPPLPPGLSLNSGTGQISGTPAAVLIQTTYTITGSNTGGIATAKIKVTINDLTPAIGYSPSTYVFTKGTAIAAITPTIAGGAISSWSVSPALPGGLAFNNANGQITGNPAAVAAAANYTVTAANGEGSAEAVLSITVKDIPPVIAYIQASFTLTKGLPAPSILPTSTGGAVVTWTVAPLLPTGLSLNPATGQVSGTPSALIIAAAYTITGTNSGGSANTSLTLTVNDAAPAFTYTPSILTFTLGTPVSAIAPVSTGGTVVTWGIAPPLPTGLAFSTATGTINGTPSAASPATPYNVTGTDSGGTSTATFTLSVTGPPPATPVVSLGTYVSSGKPGLTASTQDQGAGMAYTWTLTGGTITGGQGTPSITYTPGPVGTLTAQVGVTDPAGTATGSASATVVPMPSSELVLPASVHPGDIWMQASLPAQPGMTYLWSLVSGSTTGSITSGQGTGSVAFSVGAATGTFQLQTNVQNQAGDSVNATATVTSQTGTWLVEDGSLLKSAYQATLTVLPSGRVLMAGGFGSDPSGPLSSVEIYDPVLGIWTATVSMGTARNNHTATLLANGQVLVVGGGDSRGAAIPNAEVYDPASGVWTATESLGNARQGHTASLLTDGTVLVTGGAGSTGPLTSTEIYDPSTGTWKVVGPLQTARQAHTATLLPGAGGQVLVAGGSGTSGPLASAEQYDPGTGSWTTVGNLQAPRENHTASLLLNGQVLVAGGYGASGPLASAEIFDPLSGNWLPTGTMAIPHAFHTASTLSGGLVLVAGGTGSGYDTASEVFNPAMGTWTTTGSLETGRTLHGAAVLQNGKVLVAGGLGFVGVLASAELFDPTQGTWSGGAGRGSTRTSHTATLLLDGRVLVAGGYAGNQFPLNAVIYDPSSKTWQNTGNLAAGRWNHTATLLPGGYVLVAGGGGPGPLATSEVYSPGTNSWTGSGLLNVPRTSHTATLLTTGKVLVAGGYGTSGPLPDSELYDPSVGTWSVTGSLGSARVFHTATLLPNGKVLVTGGEDATGNPLGTTEIYDPVAGTWAPGPTLVTPRYQHSAVLLFNGKVLVAGGFGNPSSLAEYYDPATGIWTATGNLVMPRLNHSTTLLPSGQVLVAGGNGNEPGLWASAEVYDPVAGTWALTGALNSGRSYHTATLMNDGTVLAAFGDGGDTVSEIYMPVPVPPPANLAYGTGTVVLTDGVAITPDTPTETGGEATSYSINSPLPPGLNFNTSTGVITGTPTGVAGTTTYNITATNGAGSNQTTVTVTVNPGAAALLAQSGYPASITVGVAFPVTVKALDSEGNVATGFNGTVQISSSDGAAVLPSNVTLSNGTGTFTATLNTVGGETLVASTAGLPVAANTIIIGVVAAPAIASFTGPMFPSYPGQPAAVTANFSGGTGIVYPGGLAIVSGQPTNVTLNGASQFTLTVTNPLGASVSSKLILQNARVLAEGEDHTIALKNDGTLWAWGENEFGQLGNGTNAESDEPVQVPISNVVATAANLNHSLALTSDGNVWAWGFGNDGELGNGTSTVSSSPVQVSTTTGIVSVACGFFHCLAVKSDGTVWGWGSNNYGQLGQDPGTPIQVSSPIQVPGLTNVVAVAVGAYHNLALMRDGTVWAWGSNTSGQLGLGTYTAGGLPTQVPGISGAIAVACGFQHSMVILSDGSAWGWGSNSDGQLGADGGNASPTPITGVSGATDLAGMLLGSIFLEGGQILTAGNATQGGLGMTGVKPTPNWPTPIQGISNALQVQGNNYHGTALLGDGSLVIWGDNTFGESIAPGFPLYQAEPTLQNGIMFTQVTASATGIFALGLSSTGVVYGWGLNNNGQLPVNPGINQGSPVQLTDGANAYLAIAAGGYHSLALRMDGTVWGWGADQYGQLGDQNPPPYQSAPTQAQGPIGVVGIAAGDMHSLAVTASGTVWAWGLNYNGECGNGEAGQVAAPGQVQGLSGIVAVAGGSTFSMALKNDGTLWAWGVTILSLLPAGPAFTPIQVSGIANVIAISAAENTPLALTADGTVWSWSYSGGLLPVAGMPNCVAISAGDDYSLALGVDGSVWMVSLTGGQSSPVAGVVATAISVGQGFGFAITNSGVMAWGDDYYGELGIGRIVARTSPYTVPGFSMF